jgi:signal transduction histidine kinase
LVLIHRKLHRLVGHLLCLLSFLSWVGLSQAETLLLLPETKQQNLAPYLEILEDVSGRLGIDDVKQGPWAHDFKPWQGTGDLNLGYTASAWWLRFSLQRSDEAPRHWFIDLPYLNLDQVDFYAPDQKAILTGSMRPLATRPLQHRFFVFPIELDESPSRFYVRVSSGYSLTVPISAWQPEAFLQDSQQQLQLQWLYFGGLIALMLYNMLIFVSLRDQRFLFYALYVGFFGMAMLAGNGLGRVMVWPQATQFDAVSQSFFLSVAAMLSIALTRAFLNTRQLARFVHQSLSACAYAFGALAVAYAVSVWTPLPVQHLHTVMLVVGFFSAFLIMAAGCMALYKGQSGARFFVLAWGVLWTGALIASCRAMGWLPTSLLTAYSLQLSSALEMLLLALALADLIRLERHDKIEAQAQALEANQALLASSQASGEKLEQAVDQRTSQLAQALAQEKHLRDQQSRLGALISHEFRNPLGIIDSQISLLRKEKALGHAQIDKRIDIMSGAVQRLRALFDTWLNGDRIKKSLETADLKPLEINHWLQSTEQALRPLARNHRWGLQVLPHPVTVMFDADLLEIAVINLVDNACKYSPAGSQVALHLRERPGQIGIAVIDHGAGIAHEHRGRVFNAYFRVHPEGAVAGLGLGLTFVQRVADLHQGHIELESQPKLGSTFCLWLPALETPA